MDVQLTLKFGIIIILAFVIDVVFMKRYGEKIYQIPKIKEMFQRNFNNAIDLLTIISMGISIGVSTIIVNIVLKIISYIK